jgi:hypothetical protein
MTGVARARIVNAPNVAIHVSGDLNRDGRIVPGVDARGSGHQTKIASVRIKK